MRKLALLLLCGIVLCGCIPICHYYYEGNLYYVPKLLNDPYVPGIGNSLRSMPDVLPKNEKALEMYSRFEGRLPESCFSGDEDVALAGLMTTPFTQTDDFARLVIVCRLSEGTAISAEMGTWHIPFCPFLRTFAYQSKYYSDSIVLQMAETIYSGKLALFVPQMDALVFYYVLVSRFGMTKVNELFSRIYRENGQVLPPPVMLREFVPAIVNEVVATVKAAPPEKHKELLQSIAFAYTSRIMVPTEDIREFYRVYPCRTYGHELLERGGFAVMADQDLWLNYKLSRGKKFFSSPVLMFVPEYRSVSYAVGKQMHSREVWAQMQQLGISNPTELANLVVVDGIDGLYSKAESGTSTWLITPIDYRNHGEEAARLVGYFESGCPAEAIPSDASLSVVMNAVLRKDLKATTPPLMDPALALMMREGLTPVAFHFPYFTFDGGYGQSSPWPWNVIYWDDASETNLASFLHFFGAEIVWNGANMQFDWKDPAKAAEIIANGVR